MCPTGDTVTPYEPVKGVPASLRHEYVGTYPDTPGVFKLKGFRFVDGDHGQMDATMQFDVPNVFKPVNPASAAWCNTK
eukprot:gene544-19595_t